MTKSFATLLVLSGCVALAGACSSTPDPNPNPGGAGTNPTGNISGSGSLAGNTGSIAGSNGLPGAGTANGGGTPGVGGAGSTAGTSNGGTVGTAGSQGSGGSVVVNPGEGGPGYVVQKDFHGCAWTSEGGTPMSMITTPASKDFTTKLPADPFCIAGSVAADYKSVALLGFNVNEPANASCASKPIDGAAPGAPTITPTANGLAINFVKRGANTGFTLRVQIQGPNGHKPDPEGALDRWCATIMETQGKIFVPWDKFFPSCWAIPPASPGVVYNKQPISSVSFAVPGALTATPFDFCVNGVVQGASPADAPDGPAVAGDQKGTVGSEANPDGDFARAKVSVGGQDYIIQNNNWGNPGGTLILDYVNNSFKIKSGTGTGGDAPASFPSIYIGGNGFTANGVYSTHPKDNLPLKISDIKTAVSTLRYSGSTNSWNATYDIWFAKQIPTTEYKDGIDGFIMVWLRDPGAPNAKQPIGTKRTSTPVTIAGMSWDVWVGPRGPGPAGNNSAPVVSYVNPMENDNSRAQTFTNKDLKEFFTHAVAQNYGITADMYLTDVFGGFEIWDGGAGGNLAVDEFKAVITK